MCLTHKYTENYISMVILASLYKDSASALACDGLFA